MKISKFVLSASKMFIDAVHSSAVLLSRRQLTEVVHAHHALALFLALAVVVVEVTSLKVFMPEEMKVMNIINFQ